MVNSAKEVRLAFYQFIWNKIHFNSN